MKNKADKTDLEQAKAEINSTKADMLAYEIKIKGLSTDLSTLNENINLVRSETKERERRKNNLLIRGLDENDMSNDDLLHKFNELLNELHININSQTVARWGAKRHDGSGRPIMLKLEREEDVYKVLGKAKEIRTSGRTDAHNIFFVPNMTKLERERERERERQRERERDREREREREREGGHQKLRYELKDKRQSQQNFRWIIRRNQVIHLGIQEEPPGAIGETQA